tara:strand:- start:297 stop:431 length:135 start_codon:yes stop_codon:yes gene_type:complete
MNRASVWLSLGPAGEYPGWLRRPGAVGFLFLFFVLCGIVVVVVL